MPIDVESFESAPEEALRAGNPTNAERILSLLASNPEAAFTPGELHDATEPPRGSVRVVLSRLEERGLVRHREYWAIAEDADVETTITSMLTARTVSERLGPEDLVEWGAGMGG